MDGGNLSLQVHPLKTYIREHFGMAYTQDESYYFLQAKENAFVYLGLKEGIVPDDMIHDLERARENGVSFEAEKYVEKWPVRQHDHALIPAGTVHCSGADSVVLEISATPYIFTFKLWDWGRMGLDGKTTAYLAGTRKKVHPMGPDAEVDRGTPFEQDHPGGGRRRMDRGAYRARRDLLHRIEASLVHRYRDARHVRRL